MRTASSASTKRPVSISSYARDAPMSRGSSQLVPMSHAESPTLMNATLNRADCAAMRMSLPSVSASPPPDAAPFTAAMIGCGCDRMSGTRSAMYFCTFMPACGRPSPSRSGSRTPSARSSPAQNPARRR